MQSLPKDCTDRNRTSPFAFTGNRFEFRMVGYSQSTSGPNFVLNTIVADALAEIADELEKDGDLKATVQKILQRIAREHRHIVFNGDNYSGQWVEEAQRRGLPNIHSTVEALDSAMEEQNVQLFERHEVLSRAEFQARIDILLEAYSMSINIEARTMLNIAKRQILPAAVIYSGRLGEVVRAVGDAGGDAGASRKMLVELCDLVNSLYSDVGALEEAVAQACTIKGNVSKQAGAYRQDVIPAMQAVRQTADKLEMVVDADLWPLATYAEMLFLR
jgi:glutamine synthetase